MFQPEIATTWLAPTVVNVGREVAVDAVAQADQDARREPRLGLRHRGRERRIGVPPQSLERGAEVVAAGQDLERPRRSVPTIPIRRR